MGESRAVRFEGSRNATFSIFLGDDLNDAVQTAAPDNHVAVTKVAVDREFDLPLIGRGHDVGVAIAATALPVVPLAFDTAPALAGLNTVRIVGFGLAGPTSASAGRRRQGTAELTGFDELFLDLGTGSVPCSGDSGGAVFVSSSDGCEHLAGIVSFTNGGCGPGTPATNLSSSVTKPS